MRGEGRGYRRAVSRFTNEMPDKFGKWKGLTGTGEDELAKIHGSQNCLQKTGGWEEAAVIGIEPKRRQESKIRQQMSKGSLEED